MDYKIIITEDLDLGIIEEIWLSLESVAKPSYFLTWSWIETWLLTFKPKITVVQANLNDMPVALGIFTTSSEWRHIIVKAKQLRLHQTGLMEMDQVWIEYNDFIADPAHKSGAINQCLNYLAKTRDNWDELIISMTLAQHKNDYEITGTYSRVIAQKPTYKVSFSKLRDLNTSYLDTLSKNTRYQIRRSIREYQRLYGDIKLEKANSINEAIEFFNLAGEVHKVRWADSGFNNKYFLAFHKMLITKNFLKGEIEILKVSAGNKIIGIAYYFTYNKGVYFYLSGLFYENNNKLKPGMVLHSLIIQHFLADGYDFYDFMGGYSQYKESLASRSTDLISLCFQRKKLTILLENIGRDLKAKLEYI